MTLQATPPNPEGQAQEGILTPEEMEAKRQELAAKREEKRRFRRRRTLFIIGLLVFALLLCGITAYYTFHRHFPTLSTKVERDSDAPGAAESQRLNVVILGADEKPDDPGRTDTIMVASWDMSNQQVSVVSIPRDTMVSIPGRTGYHRINAAHVFGGPELTLKTLSEFLGIPLQYYVKVNFEGFKQIVDTLGGVTINVEKPMDYDDYAQDLHIHLEPGVQRLNGEQALGYVRFRHDGLGDVALVDESRPIYDGRIDRQQKFVKALIKEVLQPKTLTKLPALVQDLIDTVDTNIPYSLIPQLAMQAVNVQNLKVETVVLPGRGQNVNGASYWVSEESQLQLLVDRLFLGKHIVTVEVLNGSGIKGAARSAAERLRAQGFDVVSIADARTSDYGKTRVIMKPGLGDAGERLVAALRAQDVTETENIRSNNVDVTVIVGKDYQLVEE